MFLIEIKGMSGGNKMPKNVEGAFVNCIVPGADKNSAEELLKETLKKDGYQLVKIKSVNDFDPLAFSGKDDNYNEMADKALEFNKVQYGGFVFW